MRHINGKRGTDDKNEPAYISIYIVLLSLCSTHTPSVDVKHHVYLLCSRWSLDMPTSGLVEDMLADYVVALSLNETETETTLRCCSISERTGDTIHYVAVVSLSGPLFLLAWVPLVLLYKDRKANDRLTCLRL